MVRQSENNTFFKPSSVFFYIASLVIFFLAVHYSAKIKDIEQLFKQVDGLWLTVAVLSQTGTYILNALIFYTILGTNRHLSFFTYFKMAIVSVFINQAVPSGGLSGGGFIVAEANRRGVPTKKAFTSLILEILSFYIASVVTIIAVLVSYQAVMHRIPTLFIAVGILGILFYAALAILVTLASKPTTFEFLKTKMLRSKFLRSFLKKTFSKHDLSADKPWSYLWENKRKALLLIVFQIGIFFADACTVYAMLHGFHIQSSLYIVFVGFMLSNIIASLPLSPGSLIVFEGSMTYFYTTLGIPLHAALIATLLYRALSFWIPIPVGVLLYRTLKEADTVSAS